MSDIKLVSEEYTSRFVTGPQLQTELSKKQDDVGLYLDLDGGLVIQGAINQANYPYDNKIYGTTHFYNSIYDKDGNEIMGGSSFNYISESNPYEWPSSLSLGDGPNGTVQSIFVCGPLYGDSNKGSIFVAGPIVFNEAYDKDGKKITGGGSGGGSKWISDDTQGGKTILNLGHGSAGTVDSIFVCGPVKMYHESSSWCGTATIGIQENVMGLGGFEIKYEAPNGTKTCIGIATDTTWDNAAIEIDMYKYDGTLSATLMLDGYKLNKLASLIANANALLALLK